MTLNLVTSQQNEKKLKSPNAQLNDYLSPSTTAAAAASPSLNNTISLNNQSNFTRNAFRSRTINFGSIMRTPYIHANHQNMHNHHQHSSQYLHHLHHLHHHQHIMHTHIKQSPTASSEAAGRELPDFTRSLSISPQNSDLSSSSTPTDAQPQDSNKLSIKEKVSEEKPESADNGKEVDNLRETGNSGARSPASTCTNSIWYEYGCV